MGFDLLNNIKNGFFPKTAGSANTGLGLQDFYQVAAERGFSRDFHFRVTQLGDSKLTNEDLVYVRSASIPSRQVEIDNVSFRGFKYNVPTTVSFPESGGWNLEILMDKNYGIYEKFDAWMKNTYDIHSNVGAQVPDSNVILEMVIVDDAMSVIRTFQLHGIFPVRLGELKYNIAGQGAPVSFGVTLAFQFVKNSAQAIGSAPIGLVDSIISGLGKVTGIIQSGTNVIRSVRSIPNF